MKLALVGLSNIGKSFWATALERHLGYRRISCDDRIEQRLASKLPPPNPLSPAGTGRLAAWLGFPYTPGFEQREQEYFVAEMGVTRDATRELAALPGDAVLDTTGSVVYLPDNTVDEIKRSFTVVYLAAELPDIAALAESYAKDPKPLLWMGAYQPEPGEPPAAAMNRCYRVLVNWRARRYGMMAHVTYPRAMLPGAGKVPPTLSEVRQFVDTVTNALRQQS